MELHNRIAKASLDQFQTLPKTGKPTTSQWTVLATIVKHDSVTDKLEVVSLGTGSKCIGAKFMSPKGDILNDSHAEVICRRAFLQYLFYEIERFLTSAEEHTFLRGENKLVLRDSLSFHLFSTHVPCGDASIFPKQDPEDFGTCVIGQRCDIYGITNLKHDQREKNGSDEVPCKKRKTEPDIHRTGAKCLGNDIQDEKKSGVEYHVTGAIRTKPGRGDPTLSLSCSDKIAKWTYVGIQGALLSLLISKPIYLSTITIAGNVPFSEESITRAVCTRFTSKCLPELYKHSVPSIAQSDLSFEFNKQDSKTPCPSSIIWYSSCNKSDVAVDGKKQGVTKKNLNKNLKSGRLKICKKELFSSFSDIVSKYEFFKALSCNMHYIDVKRKAVDYIKVWDLVRNDIFKVWTTKDVNLLKFDCND